MKPQRFKPGQPITPNTKVWDYQGPDDVPTPRFGEIYHLDKYLDIPLDGEWIIELHEIPGMWYEEFGFDPVIESIEEIMEEISEHASH